MMTNNQTNPYTLLTGLGVSFNREIDIELSPEECLIGLIRDHNVVENKRLLSLSILAFKNIQDYLRPDLLKRLVKKLRIEDKASLGGIIFRDHLNTPNRWDGLKKELLKEIIFKKTFFSNQKLIELRGADPYFEKFGLMMTLVQESSEKKLLRRNWILKQNPWLKNRVFMGPSTRADVYTVKSNFLESTAYRFMKRFNYTPASLYGIWNDIELAQSLGAY